MCVSHLCTVLCHSYSDNDVNSPNLRLCGGCEPLAINFQFSFKYPHHSHQFYFPNFDTHFPFPVTWSHRKTITVTGNNIFRQRSHRRHRRPCLGSLLKGQANHQATVVQCIGKATRPLLEDCRGGHQATPTSLPIKQVLYSLVNDPLYSGILYSSFYE